MEVGRIQYSLEDKSRYEILGGSSGNRFVEVVIYYPISEERVNGVDKSPYVSDFKLGLLNPAFKRGIKKYITEGYAYDNILPMEGKFPLVFFNHGYGGYAEQNTRMVTNLVKDGFIVVSVGHAYEASAIEIHNGGYIRYDNKVKITSPMIPALIAQNKLFKKILDPLVALDEFDKFQDKYCKFMKTRVKVWADDVLFVLHDLKNRVSDNKFILRNSFDFDNVGATGHSFGGCTSFFLCMNSDEIKCGIDIDGALFGDYEGMLNKPFMTIMCAESVNTATRPIAYRKADVYRVKMKNQKHLGMTDGKLLLPSPMMSGKLDINTMENALFSAHKDFFTKYLKGEDNNFERLERATGEEVVFERFEA